MTWSMCAVCGDWTEQPVRAVLADGREHPDAFCSRPCVDVWRATSAGRSADLGASLRALAHAVEHAARDLVELLLGRTGRDRAEVERLRGLIEHVCQGAEEPHELHIRYCVPLLDALRERP